MSCCELDGSDGGRRGDETVQAFLFKCTEFAMLGGRAPEHCSVLLYMHSQHCRSKWNSAVAGSKICNGGKSIPADPDPSGRVRSETGPGNGDGLRGGYPSPGG